MAEYGKMTHLYTEVDQAVDTVNDLVPIVEDIQQDILGLASDQETDRNRITALESAVAELVDNGAKNLLQMTHEAGSVTRYGVTCTWDPIAGTMTLNGTHAASDSAAIFEFYSGNAVDQAQIPAGEYFLSGCPVGGSTSTYRGTLISITGAVDTGAGASFSLNQQTYLAYRILVSGSVTFDNMVFRPMVCSKAAWDISKKFVPYCPTLPELYAMIQAL